MKVLIESRKRYKGVVAAKVRKKAMLILEQILSTDVELSILLVDDEEMRSINREYRNIDRPTDVIAFAMREGEFPEVNRELLGDVIISVDTAGRQAFERGVTVMEEVISLLAHGILHLHGYDHEINMEEKLKMEKKEDEIKGFLETVPI